jgi:hypothetical protein
VSTTGNRHGLHDGRLVQNFVNLGIAQWIVLQVVTVTRQDVRVKMLLLKTRLADALAVLLKVDTRQMLFKY